MPSEYDIVLVPCPQSISTVVLVPCPQSISTVVLPVVLDVIVKALVLVPEQIQDFRVRLKAAAEKALLERPVPGKANGVLLLHQPLLIEAYVGLMAMVGNQNKLGYCLARGHIGL